MKIALQVSDPVPGVPAPEALTISIYLLTDLHTDCIPGVLQYFNGTRCK